MTKSKKLGLTRAIGAGLLFAGIDQLSKIWVLSSIKNNEITLIDNFFWLKYSENFGIAFSIPIPFFILITAIILLLIFLVIFSIQEFDVEKKLTQLSIGLIIGGGIGNLIDRLLHGFVIDFISIWKYPIFNVADIFITVGVLSLIVFYGKMKRS